MNDNLFTLTFGKQPLSFIERNEIKNRVLKGFNLDNPFSYTHPFTGLRGLGKTVLLTNIVR